MTFWVLQDRTGQSTHEYDDSTGLYYMGARYYDPEIGRFITPDSIIDNAKSTMGWNRYMYVHGNPVMCYDPTGHESDFLSDLYDYFFADDEDDEDYYYDDSYDSYSDSFYSGYSGYNDFYYHSEDYVSGESDYLSSPSYSDDIFDFPDVGLSDWESEASLSFDSMAEMLDEYLGGMSLGMMDWGAAAYSSEAGGGVAHFEYSQSTGYLMHVDEDGITTYFSTGHAGNGAGRNNPSMQFVSNVGPIPVGTYTIGPRGDHTFIDSITGDDKILKGSMMLTPDPDNNMGPRFGFLIHGGNYSRGCIIMSDFIRDIIGKSGITALEVVH